MSEGSGTPVLEVKDLRVHFRGDDAVGHAVNGVTFHVDEGESVAIVGESGSGKSVTNMAVLRLLPQPPAEIPTGEIRYRGQDLLKLSKREIRKVRGGKISMIFQDPMTSLNPFLRISKQLTETIELHTDLRGRAARERAIEALDLVGIPDAAGRIDCYPHEFSGGMRQRVMIAIALSTNPDLLIADEPTTALDVTIQAQILVLIKRLQRERGMSLIMITHDLAVVAGMCSRVVVMYGGVIVESADVDDLFEDPRHPYTIALLRSIPRVDAPGQRLDPIEGLPPKLTAEPTHCTFAPRCQFAEDGCWKAVPVLEPDEDGRLRACFLPIRDGQVVPKGGATPATEGEVQPGVAEP
ncbi:MAG: ABC transporter ATP-binding protein, partial [Planctomycetes bacterium]|nr:ABC transporter ATP-binding protein [Planctomycetota bacterium]